MKKVLKPKAALDLLWRTLHARQQQRLQRVQREGRMLAALLTKVSALLLVSRATAGEVQVAWSPSPTAGITNYVVTGWLGTNSQSLNVGTNLSAHLTGLAPGVWKFTARAEKAGATSDPSNEVTHEVIAPPVNARTVALERILDFTATNRVELFRLVIP